MRTIIVTGGFGFIGSNLVKLLNDMYESFRIIVVDSMTYAADTKNLEGLRHEHWNIDISNTNQVNRLLELNPKDVEGIIHLAAESHVDNSINGPMPFVFSNVVGTVNLLEIARKFHEANPKFRFLHVSTDEVYGSLNIGDERFSENTAYDPRSPYSASKASSDHFVMAYHHTYGLPVNITNCSNNYGPNQHDEKLIPTVIRSIVNNQSIPVYGNGKNIRDWLFVEDHCRAIMRVFNTSNLGRTYCIGGDSEMSNLDLIYSICDLCDLELGRSGRTSSRNLITFVEDRKGHDFRYAIDHGLISFHTGWHPLYNLQSGLRETVNWYLNKYTDDKHITKNNLNNGWTEIPRAKDIEETKI
jgi:dTDP-glucose 4,6-dehydratase